MARQDPIELLTRQEAARLSWLVPVRHSRMAENPFAFFRGAAAVMAADLARKPSSGLMVQLCGDAHLLNFGFFCSPEYQLLFDINDFDETHPGPFEWDVIRLATSFILAARSLGCSEKEQSKVCRSGVRAYAEAMAEFAGMRFEDIWVPNPALQHLIDERTKGSLRAHLKKLAAMALQRNSRQAVRKLCEVDNNGTLLFRHQPPLLWRYSLLPPEALAGMDWQHRLNVIYAEYLASVRPDVRRYLSEFRMSDAAFKAVGVGSVGTQCGIHVFMGVHPEDVLVLQSKQAEPSVLAPYVNGDNQVPAHQGQRVVEGQRLMQTASDPFLGWTTTPEGTQLYWRVFRDWKASVDVNELDVEGLKDYGKLCALTLAKSHARSGDRKKIHAFIHDPKMFATTIYEQAIENADLAEQDHKALLQAIADGRLEASMVY
nr:DUF2252 domain-containing protein [Vulcanococcus sp. Clear-D1]